MDNILALMGGFATTITFNNLVAVVVGSFLGLIVGAMPGIGSLAGVALLLPLTFAFDPTTAIILLCALYFGNMYGGAFSAILLNVPGDSPAVMTAIDGYPMATKKKRPGQALFTAIIASYIGGTIGVLIITFLGPSLATFGLRFGPAEMTALLIMSLSSVGWLMGEKPIKGIIVTLLGIIIGTIGIDPLTGWFRYNFGVIYLMGGIPFIPFVIGSVGFAQVIQLMESRVNKNEEFKGKLTIVGSLPSKDETRRMLPPALRSGVLGTFVGVLPGAGATMATFLGYAFQKGFKSKEPLGSGAVEGIASVEAANNSAAAGSIAPLLALGIPGSGTTAVLLGGLLMWGLNPGPLLFSTAPDFVWGTIASLYAANLVSLVISALTIPFLIKILAVPVKLLIPLITVVCLVGSFAATNSMYGVIVMLFSGILGYFLTKNNYPIAPMLLAFILTPMLEVNMRRAFVISHGSPMIFVTQPISLAFLLVTCFLILFPIFKLIVKKIRNV